MFNRATEYVVLSAYIKRLKSDIRVLLQLKQGFLLVKYSIPFLCCRKHVRLIKSRIWDSFLTRV